ncbi:MAG: ACT domain-containing protein [Salipiger thiooxidans]|uniref:ACT domain-containing protein n=1 Tax=Salipiger thiooxidans TaxID=282683 RepID=UPI001CFAE8DE|nr:ACT domain-containing protein [Salipiger thiooxidans]
MSGERRLDVLLQSLSAQLADELFVFATVPPGPLPAGLAPRMTFHEAEGVTLILPRDEAEAHGLDHGFPRRMITLAVHSSLEAVGFVAHIATRLAAAGISVNPVSGFYHDHLFVPDGREAEALGILESVAGEFQSRA